jgi:cytochrome c oxidase subunit II
MFVMLPTMLDPSGSSAREIAALWWLLVGLGALAFVVVAVALAVGLRRRPDDGPSTGGRRWLIGGGVVLPSVLIVGVLIATIASMRAVSTDASDDAVAIEIVGNQWWWEVRYPDEQIVTANEVHIPAGRDVVLELVSADVIHSFWVPDLAGKMDLLPERANTLVIDADRPGRYEGACAEFCGLQHANMRLIVVAHDELGYARWLDEQRREAAAPNGELELRGRRLFETKGCAGCHTVAGTGADGEEGPDLTHVASRETIAAGTMDNTVPNLREWIADPHAIKDGVLMPAVQLDPDELDALVAYLDSLR